MKGNLINKILIFSALIIWSIIIYKYFFALDDQINTPGIVAVDQLANKKEENIQNDTLLLNYPDPFTKKVYTKRKSVKKLKKNRNGTLENEKAPTIVFNGMAKNKSMNKTYAWVSINGIEHVLTEGQKVENIFIKKIDNKQLTINYNGIDIKIDKSDNLPNIK